MPRSGYYGHKRYGVGFTAQNHQENKYDNRLLGMTALNNEGSNNKKSHQQSGVDVYQSFAKIVNYNLKEQGNELIIAEKTSDEMRNILDEFVSELQDNCNGQVHSILAGKRGQYSEDSGYKLNLWKNERNTWALLKTIYRGYIDMDTNYRCDRTGCRLNMQVSTQDQVYKLCAHSKEVNKDNICEFDVDRAMQRIDNYRQIKHIIDWLETQFRVDDKLERSDYNSDPYLSYYQHTLAQTKKVEAFATTAAQDIDHFPSLDPDAPKRGQLKLKKIDADGEKYMMKEIFKLLRAGEIEKAQLYCRDWGHSWMSVILEGAYLYRDQYGETNRKAKLKNRNEISGTMNRALWKRCCAEYSTQGGIDGVYERAIFSLFGGLPDPALEVCESYEDGLWVMCKLASKTLLEQQTHQLKNSDGGVYINLDNIPFTFKGIFDKLSASTNKSITHWITEPFHVIQRNLINGDIEDLVDYLCLYISQQYNKSLSIVSGSGGIENSNNFYRPVYDKYVGDKLKKFGLDNTLKSTAAADDFILTINFLRFTAHLVITLRHLNALDEFDSDLVDSDDEQNNDENEISRFTAEKANYLLSLYVKHLIESGEDQNQSKQFEYKYEEGVEDDVAFDDEHHNNNMKFDDIIALYCYYLSRDEQQILFSMYLSGKQQFQNPEARYKAVESALQTAMQYNIDVEDVSKKFMNDIISDFASQDEIIQEITDQYQNDLQYKVSCLQFLDISNYAVDSSTSNLYLHHLFQGCRFVRAILLRSKDYSINIGQFVNQIIVYMKRNISLYLDNESKGFNNDDSQLNDDMKAIAIALDELRFYIAFSEAMSKYWLWTEDKTNAELQVETYHAMRQFMEIQWLLFDIAIPSFVDPTSKTIPNIDMVKGCYFYTAEADWYKLRCKYIPFVYELLCDLVYQCDNKAIGQVVNLITLGSNYDILESDKNKALKIILKLQEFHLSEYLQNDDMMQQQVPIK